MGSLFEGFQIVSGKMGKRVFSMKYEKIYDPHHNTIRKNINKQNYIKNKQLVSNEKQEGGGEKSGRGDPRKQTDV